MVMAAPLHAQDELEAPTGSRIKEKRETPKSRAKKNQDEDAARRLAKRFGKCVYDRRKQQSVKLLTVSDYKMIDYDNLGEAEYLLTNQILMNDCLGRTGRSGLAGMGMTISNSVIRSSLAEEAYLDVYRDKDLPITLASDAPEVLLNRYLVHGRTYEDARAAASFSDCVVYQAPDKAHAILHTKPTSKQEHEAVMAIVPAIGRCIKSGQEMRLDVNSIRAFIADGLWARAHYGPKVTGSEGSE